MTIGIWVKNLSSIAHNITRIEGECEEYPGDFKIEIFGNKYKLPIALSPDDPDKNIYFIGQFSSSPSPNCDCNIKIKVFSRWKGKEIESGKLKVKL